jgi:hypothetical protein
VTSRRWSPGAASGRGWQPRSAASIPDPFDKGLAAQLLACFVLFGELALDHQLGRYAGVVGARNPKRHVPTHAPPPGEDVDLGVFQHVPHVQPPGNVGWRQQHGEGRTIRRTGGVCSVWLVKQCLFDPVGRPSGFDRGRVIGFWKITGHGGRLLSTPRHHPERAKSGECSRTG